MLPISDKLKLTFQLTAHDKYLEVRATAPAGEGRAKTALPPRTLLDQLAAHDPTYIPSAVLESIGKTLYQCLMVGDVARLASDVLQDGIQLRQPVQFELRFDADQVALAQYPWEMLADPFGQFLVREGLVDVTRYIAYPQPPPAFDVGLHHIPLLRVVSQPSKLPPIRVLDLALESIETLQHATFEQFLRKLLIDRIALWGLQFDGHGGLMSQCRQCDALNRLSANICRMCGAPLSDAKQVGVLAFERNGDVDWIPTAEFGSVLYNANVRLALLLACETGRVGDRLVFSGLAPGLILAGVPAVVGMQYPVLDDFANSFASSFYATLLGQNDVLAALRTARKMNIQGAWYSPVLYLRHHRTARTDETLESAYHARSIDTAVPTEVQAGVDFLVRLWIRRPETKPLTPKQLREELGVPESVPISTREAGAEVKFKPVEGRLLRRGEVEVQLSSMQCTVTPGSIKLFVDEHLDAPPAIFTVRARQVGQASLLFSVWQDGGQIACIAHHIQVADRHYQPGVIEAETHVVPGQEAMGQMISPRIRKRWAETAVPTTTCPQCGTANRHTARFCARCGGALIMPAPQAGSAQVTHCPSCGVPVTPSAAFCDNCGAALSSIAASPAMPPMPPQPAPPAPPSMTGSLEEASVTGTLPTRQRLGHGGRYVIQSKIVQGGMGAVYKALDTHLQNQVVAIKEMNEQFIGPDERPQVLAAFKREAEMLVCLDHPNLVKALNFFEEDGQHYIVMEFILGRSLLEILEEDSPGGLPEDRVLGWAVQLCDVLAYLHSQSPKIIYRNLKPDNVMEIAGTTHIKLIDFGIARFYKPGQRRDTFVLGAPGYAPPEQHGLGQTDERSDIYSLGATLHHLLTGRHPSEESFRFPPVHSMNSRVSQRVSDAIARALVLRREDRFVSVMEMKVALLGGASRSSCRTEPGNAGY